MTGKGETDMSNYAFERYAYNTKPENRMRDIRLLQSMCGYCEAVHIDDQKAVSAAMTHGAFEVFDVFRNGEESPVAWLVLTCEFKCSPTDPEPVKVLELIAFEVFEGRESDGLIEELHGFLVEQRDARAAAVIRCAGRLGWERRLKHLGYRVTAQRYELKRLH